MATLYSFVAVSGKFLAKMGEIGSICSRNYSGSQKLGRFQGGNW